MPVDPYAVLHALLRAEAARERTTEGRAERERATEPSAGRTTPERSAEPERRAN
ncbi:hypothetical protein [Streptomyces sp. NPDC056069]|uniref:hypothetical protein n=1 Tax=Streptomyces sp. NPDC056069 TaxID=3345702 RepID=UPI0035E21850